MSILSSIRLGPGEKQNVNVWKKLLRQWACLGRKSGRKSWCSSEPVSLDVGPVRLRISGWWWGARQLFSRGIRLWGHFWYGTAIEPKLIGNSVVNNPEDPEGVGCPGTGGNEYHGKDQSNNPLLHVCVSVITDIAGSI